MPSIKEALDNATDTVVTTPPAEGKWTKQIENQTAKIPSVFFLNLAIGSVVLSAINKAVNPKSTVANFIGLWVPTFLLLGVYNKLVKIEGNDRYNRA
jgi:hypothetical protein